MKTFINQQLAFNTFANNTYIDWLDSCGTAFVTTPVHKTSILKQIKHLRKVHHYWTDFISGKDINLFQWTESDKDFATEAVEFRYAVLNFAEICGQFETAELMENLNFNAVWASNTLPRRDYILHNINHSTNHRGQIAALARSLGYEGKIPLTEYSVFLGNYNK